MATSWTPPHLTFYPQHLPSTLCMTVTTTTTCRGLTASPLWWWTATGRTTPTALPHWTSWSTFRGSSKTTSHVAEAFLNSPTTMRLTWGCKSRRLLLLSVLASSEHSTISRQCFFCCCCYCCHRCFQSASIATVTRQMCLMLVYVHMFEHLVWIWVIVLFCFAYRAPLPTLPEQNLSKHNLNKLDVQLRKWREGTMVRKSLQPRHWTTACVLVVSKLLCPYLKTHYV